MLLSQQHRLQNAKVSPNKDLTGIYGCRCQTPLCPHQYY